MADSQAFRQAWGKFATGVSVVTSKERDGLIHGMAANGIASVSMDPMLVLVCVGHNRNSYEHIKGSGRFAINILSEDQRHLAEYYAMPHEQRKGEPDATFTMTKAGAAFLDGSLAKMDCHLVDEYVAGDHSIFIGEVDEIELSEGRPLMFSEGKFRRLDADGPVA